MDNINIIIINKIYKSIVDYFINEHYINILYLKYYFKSYYIESITTINILYERTYSHRNNITISYRYRIRYE